jgi:hypothetical protein
VPARVKHLVAMVPKNGRKRMNECMFRFRACVENKTILYCTYDYYDKMLPRVAYESHFSFKTRKVYVINFYYSKDDL